MFIEQKLLKHVIPAFKGHRARESGVQSQFGLYNKHVTDRSLKNTIKNKKPLWLILQINKNAYVLFLEKNQ